MHRNYVLFHVAPIYLIAVNFTLLVLCFQVFLIATEVVKYVSSHCPESRYVLIAYSAAKIFFCSEFYESAQGCDAFQEMTYLYCLAKCLINKLDPRYMYVYKLH